MSGRRSFLSRYRQTNLWTRIGFWGSIASIISLLLFFLPSKQDNANQRISLEHSPNSTIYQASRDIVINYPSTSNLNPEPPKTQAALPNETFTPKSPVPTRSDNRLDAKTYINRAMSLYKERRYKEAIAECNKALRVDPKNDRAFALKRQVVNTVTILNDSNQSDLASSLQR